jgi:hypothetical protein
MTATRCRVAWALYIAWLVSKNAAEAGTNKLIYDNHVKNCAVCREAEKMSEREVSEP